MTSQFFLQRVMVRDRKRTERDVKYVKDNWKIQRILPCHGNIIEGPEAQKAFDTLFQPFMHK